MFKLTPAILLLVAALLTPSSNGFTSPAFVSIARTNAIDGAAGDAGKQNGFTLFSLPEDDDDDEYYEIFRDDFKKIDESKWSFEYGRHGGWGNGEEQSYTNSPDNCFIDEDGALNVKIIKLDHPQWDDAIYTSARLTTHRKFNFTFGRIEARVQVSHEDGPFSAIWALSDKMYDQSVKWPLCGEIDLFEYQSIWEDYTPQTLHFKDHNGADDNDYSYHFRPRLSPNEWHTVRVDWTPDYIAFFINDKLNGIYGKPPERFISQNSWPYDKYNTFHLIINNAMNPDWASKWKPASQNFKEHTLKVDYISVKQKKNY